MKNDFLARDGFCSSIMGSADRCLARVGSGKLRLEPHKDMVLQFPDHACSGRAM